MATIVAEKATALFFFMVYQGLNYQLKLQFCHGNKWKVLSQKFTCTQVLESC